MCREVEGALVSPLTLSIPASCTALHLSSVPVQAPAAVPLPWSLKYGLSSGAGRAGPWGSLEGVETAVVRGGLVRRRIGEGDDGFRWRGEEVWRLEGFIDAVFAFAVTLLVVSLEVPATFGELLDTMRGFLAFAISFALLMSVWYEHYKFCRRYGLRDVPTIWLSLAMLFVVLLFVYPLKFLFTLVIDGLLGFSEVAGTIEPSQEPLLFVIYGAGFVAVQLVFVLLYLRAYALRDTLELGARELLVTRKEIQSFLLNVSVGLASISIALAGGAVWTLWAGLIYFLIGPLQTINGFAMGSRIRAMTEDRGIHDSADAEDDAEREEGEEGEEP